MIGFYSLVLLDFSSRNKEQNVLLKEQLYTVAVYCLSVVNREALFKPTKATKNASDPNRSLSLFRLFEMQLFILNKINREVIFPNISPVLYLDMEILEGLLLCMRRGVLCRSNTWYILHILTKISLQAEETVGSEHSLSPLNCLRIQKCYIRLERMGKYLCTS